MLVYILLNTFTFSQYFRTRDFSFRFFRNRNFGFRFGILAFKFSVFKILAFGILDWCNRRGRREFFGILKTEALTGHPVPAASSRSKGIEFRYDECGTIFIVSAYDS